MKRTTPKKKAKLTTEQTCQRAIDYLWKNNIPIADIQEGYLSRDRKCQSLASQEHNLNLRYAKDRTIATLQLADDKRKTLESIGGSGISTLEVILLAINEVENHSVLNVITNLEWLRNCVNELGQWEDNNWRTVKGGSPSNVEIWMKIWEEMKSKKVNLRAFENPQALSKSKVGDVCSANNKSKSILKPVDAFITLEGLGC